MGATELFPRLLQVIEIYPSTQKSFTDLVCDPLGCVFKLLIQVAQYRECANMACRS